MRSQTLLILLSRCPSNEDMKKKKDTYRFINNVGFVVDKVAFFPFQ
jgi:hypothetical protein